MAVIDHQPMVNNPQGSQKSWDPCVGITHPRQLQVFPGISQGTGPHKDSGVYDVLCPALSRFHVRDHLYWYGDLLIVPVGHGIYSHSSWLLYAHPPGGGGHGFWLDPHPVQWWLFALCQWLFAFTSDCLPFISSCSSSLSSVFLGVFAQICLYVLCLH